MQSELPSSDSWLEVSCYPECEGSHFDPLYLFCARLDFLRVDLSHFLDLCLDGRMAIYCGHFLRAQLLHF